MNIVKMVGENSLIMAACTGVTVKGFNHLGQNVPALDKTHNDFTMLATSSGL